MEMPGRGEHAETQALKFNCRGLAPQRQPASPKRVAIVPQGGGAARFGLSVRRTNEPNALLADGLQSHNP